MDCRTIREAALLSRDAKLSFWDSLIVVSASRCGASTLYTEDLADGTVLLGVRIVNPLARPAGSVHDSGM